MFRPIIVGAIFLLCLASCREIGAPLPHSASETISSDAQLFNLVTQSQPFTSYTLFPGVDSVTSGTLNGSIAHRPFVRVSMNATALSALQSDTLPAGASFPDGSVIFKQIRDSSQAPTLYAVEYKDENNPFAARGWLWAEYHLDGSVAFSITSIGSGCIGCHSNEQGPQHDYVRTFERRH